MFDRTKNKMTTKIYNWDGLVVINRSIRFIHWYRFYYGISILILLTRLQDYSSFPPSKSAWKGLIQCVWEGETQEINLFNLYYELSLLCWVERVDLHTVHWHHHRPGRMANQRQDRAGDHRLCCTGKLQPLEFAVSSGQSLLYCPHGVCGIVH